MKIEIIRWQSEGLRCPDAAIDLTQDGRPAHVALLQMPNGTGKTTTLTMLRAAMCGKQLDPKLIQELKRHDSDRDDGRFELELRIDGEPLTIEVKLNFEESSVQYFLSSPKTGGLVKGWEPPPNARRFLNERFVDLFIFDGEFADHLLDRRRTRAGEAIDSLFQLYLLDDVSKRAQDDWEEATRSKSTKSDQGLVRHENALKRIKTRIKTVQALRTKQTNRLTEIAIEIGEIEAKLEQKLNSESELAKQLESAKVFQVTAAEKVNAAAVDVLSHMRHPHYLHGAFTKAFVELRDNFDRLKLPASSSKQFFEELVGEPECICGRPLDEGCRAHIRARAETVMGEDTSGVLNSLKADIQLAYETTTSNPAILSDSMTVMVDAITDRDDFESKVRALEDAYAASGGDETAQLQATLQKLRDDQAELEEVIEDIDRSPNAQDRSKDVDKLFCLKQLKALATEEGEKIAEITGTVRLRNQTELLRKILSRSLESARERIRATLRDECNERLLVVLERDPILIENISSHLTLRNQAGASVGQTLSIGYTFLATLLNRGQHTFPLVVDSPANPLSKEIRREVGRLVPKLCNQFVAFTTSAERDGFTTTIDAAYPGEVKFMTMFRRTAGTRKLEDSLPTGNFTMTASGVLVEGRDYFNRFDDIDEEGNP